MDSSAMFITKILRKNFESGSFEKKTKKTVPNSIKRWLEMDFPCHCAYKK